MEVAAKGFGRFQLGVEEVGKGRLVRSPKSRSWTGFFCSPWYVKSGRPGPFFAVQLVATRTLKLGVQQLALPDQLFVSGGGLGSSFGILQVVIDPHSSMAYSAKSRLLGIAEMESGHLRVGIKGVRILQNATSQRWLTLLPSFLKSGLIVPPRDSLASLRG